jgi:prolyl-tRNA synthetase
MCHGDDNGLRVPPSLAPIQAYVMVVKGEATSAAAGLVERLRDAGVRVALDDRVDTAFGRRAVDAELKGYPVRVEVGPRDLASGNVVLVRRFDGTKTAVALDNLVGAVLAALEADQKALYDEALARRIDRTVDVSTVDDAIAAASTGWARVPWSAVGIEGEAKANADGVTVRCLTRADGSVPGSEEEPDLVAYLGRAY